jgi:F-type H+-transporting ATPase subunit gamma
MQSLRIIRRKIAAVKNLQKITRAMKMVAAARLRRVQDKVTAGRPYAERLEEMIRLVAPYAQEVEHPLLKRRDPIRRVGLVVMTADRGLCGSYNNNVIRAAVRFIERQNQEGRPVRLFTLGRKGRAYFEKRNYDLYESFAQLKETAPFVQFQAVADSITHWFTSGDVDEVYIAYTRFLSAMRQMPLVVKFLPIEPPETMDRGEVEYLFEPAAPELLQVLIPRYVHNRVYQYLLEAIASEHAARMLAMGNATDNATELIQQLTLQFNKARQASITKEILEVVSGAEALRSSA